MKKFTCSTFIMLFIIMVTPSIFAQEVTQPAENEEEKGEELSLTGSVDTYFHSALGRVENAPRTSFANLPGFSLGMINLIAYYTGKKSGFVADLVYGPRGSDAVFNAPLYINAGGGASTQIINQMYVYYQVSSKVRIKLGQINTYFDNEVISPTMNFHYSTSYLFSYGPFIHTGLWADFDLGKGWSGKLSIMNPTDFVEYNPFGTYTIGGQLAYANDKGNVYLNVASGDQDGKLEDADPIGATSAGNTLRVNLNTGWTISEKYYVGLNTSYTTTDVGEAKDVTGIRDSVGDNYGFYGLALYQKLTINDVFMLGLRAEYFSEFKGGVGAIGGYDADGKASVTGITLSVNYLSGNFRFIPEFRYDMTSEDTFTEESSGASIATMPSINFAVVYTLPAMNHKIHSKN